MKRDDRVDCELSLSAELRGKGSAVHATRGGSSREFESSNVSRFHEASTLSPLPPRPLIQLRRRIIISFRARRDGPRVIAYPDALLFSPPLPLHRRRVTTRVAKIDSTRGTSADSHATVATVSRARQERTANLFPSEPRRSAGKR